MDLMLVLKCWCWEETGEEYSVLVRLSSVTSEEYDAGGDLGLEKIDCNSEASLWIFSTNSETNTTLSPDNCRDISSCV